MRKSVDARGLLARRESVHYFDYFDGKHSIVLAELTHWAAQGMKFAELFPRSSQAPSGRSPRYFISA
jgi:hypothetical protein